MSSRAVCHFIFSSLQQWYVWIKNFFSRGFCIRAELLISLLYSEAYTIKVELMVGCQYMWLLPSTVPLKCCKHWIRNQWDFPVFMQSLGYSHTTLFCSFYGYNIATGLLFTFTLPGPSVPMTLMIITSCVFAPTTNMHQHDECVLWLLTLPSVMGGTGYGGVNTNRRLCSITVNYNIDWCPMD